MKWLSRRKKSKSTTAMKKYRIAPIQNDPIQTSKSLRADVQMRSRNRPPMKENAQNQKTMAYALRRVEPGGIDCQPRIKI